MKTIIVTGSRRWWDPAPLKEALRGADALIVGDCPPDATMRSSADALALCIALRWDIVPHVLAASPGRAEFLRSKGVHVDLVSDWQRDGKRAGPLRNRAIVRAALAARELGEVACHAFPLGTSLGTRDCVRQLRAARFAVEVHLGRWAPVASSPATALKQRPGALLCPVVEIPNTGKQLCPYE